MSAVWLWQTKLPPVDTREALRYAGVKESTPEINELLQECIQLCQTILTPRVCYRFYPVTREDGLDLGFAQTDSLALKRNLAGCEEIVLFAATIGLEMDRLIARYAHVSPSKSVMLQAIGAERIESLCDAFENELIRQGHELGTRFSPGYGDLPLDLQRDIFAALDCSRQIGVSLNDSLLMSPSKSVSAIIGLNGETSERCVHNCALCTLPNCLYRR